MDPTTIAIALLTAVIAVLAALVWLGHLDVGRILGRMDQAIDRMDRSLEHMDHAVERMDQSTAACNRAADACQSMAEAMRLMVHEQIMRDRPQPGPAE
jgi:hypothetical protein